MRGSIVISQKECVIYLLEFDKVKLSTNSIIVRARQDERVIWRYLNF
jgi:hypothetical protein